MFEDLIIMRPNHLATYTVQHQQLKIFFWILMSKRGKRRKKSLNYNTPVRHSRIGHTYKRETDCIRCCSSMCATCSLNVLSMSCCHPLNSVTDGQRSISSSESFEHPLNIELNLKRSEIECTSSIWQLHQQWAT